MEKDFYYTAPSLEIFEDIKKCAIQIWQTYDNTYGYVDEKVDRIKDIKNFKDNCIYIVGMFDQINQVKLYDKLQSNSKTWLLKFLSYEKEEYEKLKNEN